MEPNTMEKKHSGAEVALSALSHVAKKPGVLEQLQDDFYVRLRVIALLTDATTSASVRNYIGNLHLDEGFQRAADSSTVANESNTALYTALFNAAEEGRIPKDSPLLVMAAQIAGDPGHMNSSVASAYHTASTSSREELESSGVNEYEYYTKTVPSSCYDMLVDAAKREKRSTELSDLIEQSDFPEDIKRLAADMKSANVNNLIETTMATRMTLLETPVLGSMLKLNGVRHDVTEAVKDMANGAKEMINDAREKFTAARESITGKFQRLRDKVADKLSSALEHASVFGRLATSEALEHLQVASYAHRLNKSIAEDHISIARHTKQSEQLNSQLESLAKQIEKISDVAEKTGDARFEAALSRKIDQRDLLVDKLNNTTEHLVSLDRSLAYSQQDKEGVDIQRQISFMDRIKFAWEKTVDHMKVAHENVLQNSAESSVKMLPSPDSIEGGPKRLTGPRA